MMTRTRTVTKGVEESCYFWETFGGLGAKLNMEDEEDIGGKRPD